MKERYHRCFKCRARATSSVVTVHLKLPNGKPWAMYACLRHAPEMYTLSDTYLGGWNAIVRTYSSGTGGIRMGANK